MTRSFMFHLSRLVTGLCGALVLASAQGQPAPAQKLRIVGGLGGLNQYTRNEESFWTKELSRLSAGKFDADIVPFDRAGVPGGDMLRLIQLGVVPFGTAPLGAMSAKHPAYNAPDLVGVSDLGVSPHLIKLELTESLVLDNMDDTIAKMSDLKALGVRFSMDDFGTGYSSLAYLTRLPMDQLKIDQSFVRNIGIQRTDGVIVQTIIGMARNLALEVIAEGVETQAQQAFLALHGCTLYQGYLFGKPTPLAQFEALLTPVVPCVPD